MQKKQKNINSKEGFSLVEMMLVLLIVAAVIGVGQDHWRGYRAKQALLLASSELMEFIHYWRQLANGTQQQITLVAQLSQPLVCSIAIEYAGKPQTTFILRTSGVGWGEREEQIPITLIGRRNHALGGHFTLMNAIGKVRVIVSGLGRVRRCALSTTPIGDIAPC